MTTINLPPQKFTKWIEIDDWNREIPTRVMGLYLVASKSKKPTSSKANPLDKDIIYIGMTTQSLQARLRFLINAIKGKKAAHSGGRRICGKYGVYPNDYKRKRLYIAYWAPFGERGEKKEFKDFKNMGIVTYLEYLLLGKFYKKFGKTPRCNADRRGE